jgi:rhodanese-related sulfurtransferase
VAIETIDGGAVIDEVAPGDVPAMRDSGAAMLDVRTTSECADGMIEGAVNIPYTRLIPRLGEVPEGEPIIVNCKAGGRSAAACTMLARAGRTVVNLEGGYQAWLAAIEAQPALATQTNS